MGEHATPYRAAGWAVATVDSAGVLHLDWDGELHRERVDAEREWEECRAAHWKSCLLKLEIVGEIKGGDPFDE